MQVVTEVLTFERDSSRQFVVDYFLIVPEKGEDGNIRSWETRHIGCGPVIGWGMVKLTNPENSDEVDEEKQPIIADVPAYNSPVKAIHGHTGGAEFHAAHWSWRGMIDDGRNRAEWRIRYVSEGEWEKVMDAWQATSFTLRVPARLYDWEEDMGEPTREGDWKGRA